MAGTVRLAIDAGLAGCSIEDFSGCEDDPIYEPGVAAERIAAAAGAAHGGPGHLVLTARSENYLHGRRDLDDTISRLQVTRRPEPTCSTPRVSRESRTSARSWPPWACP